MDSAGQGRLLIQGALYKRRGSKISVLTGRSWDQRWFILTSSCLTYYSSQEDHDWGAAGTVLSLSSLRRFEPLSSLVFQLYFYQRILQLRALHRQEAQRWLACLQSAHAQQQLPAVPNPVTMPLSAIAAVAENAAPAQSPKKPLQAAGSGVLLVNARASNNPQDNRICSSDTRGVLPSHLLVQESRVSYSPLSEHALSSPFLSDTHRSQLQKAKAAAVTSSSTQTSEQEDITVNSADFGNSGVVHSQKALVHERPSISLVLHRRSLSGSHVHDQHQQMQLTARSASYHPGASSPFDHATGGLMASEDIEQLYALPEGAHPGRLRRTEDFEAVQDAAELLFTPHGLAVARAMDVSAGSSPVYLSCSSGSDAADSVRLQPGQQAHLGSSYDHAANSIPAHQLASSAQSVQRDSDDMVFWVPELGSQSQSFTEYTKQQMQQTASVSTYHLTAPQPLHSMHYGTAPVTQHTSPISSTECQSHPHAWTSPSCSPGHQSHPYAWTSPWAGANQVQAASFSSSWNGSFSTVEQPHPPTAPSPYAKSAHALSAHATTGFRGGSRQDPRLRRFRDALACESGRTMTTAVADLQPSTSQSLSSLTAPAVMLQPATSGWYKGPSMEASFGTGHQAASLPQKTGLEPSSRQQASSRLQDGGDQTWQAELIDGSMPASLHGSNAMTGPESGVLTAALDANINDSVIKRYGSIPPSLAWQAQTEQPQNMHRVAQQASPDHQAPSMQSLAWQAGSEQGHDSASVHWEAVQVESLGSPNADVAWAEYCSDSEESADFQGPELATEPLHTIEGQSRKEWSAKSD